LDLSQEDKNHIISHLDIIPSSSEMNDWSEATRQELIWNPIRFEFLAPVVLQPYRSLSALSYSLTDIHYRLLGSSVKEASIYHHSQRSKKSYTREKLLPGEVDDILKKRVGDDLSDIAISGRLVASKDVEERITGLHLRCGILELQLDLDWVKETFGSCEDFYMQNRSSSPRVYVLCHKEGYWSVRNWGKGISQLVDEDDLVWRKRVKSTLRDRNRFIVSNSIASNPNVLGLSDERGMS
jgi:hypothetical protein